MYTFQHRENDTYKWLLLLELQEKPQSEKSIPSKDIELRKTTKIKLSFCYVQVQAQKMELQYKKNSPILTEV